MSETPNSVKKNNLKILVKKLTPDAQLPTQEARDIPDACWDLYCNELRRRIPGGGKLAIKTGIAMAIPEGWNGHVRPRSGNALRTSLMVDAGVIDPGYRGEIMVVLANISDYPVDVDKNMKIAQIKFERIPDVEFEEVKDLPSSDRNTGGFGSTDKK